MSIWHNCERVELFCVMVSDRRAMLPVGWTYVQCIHLLISCMWVTGTMEKDCVLLAHEHLNLIHWDSNKC